MHRPLVVATVTAAACAAAGCVPETSAGSTAAAVGGTALAIAGTAMLVDLKSPGNDTDGNGVDDFPENDIACAIGGCAIATTMLVGGLALAVAGFVGLGREDAPLPIPPPMPAGERPGEAAPIDVRLVAPLPEVPVDQTTLQLAKQARSAARQGDCDTARLITRHIADRDPRYAGALAASPALARCR